MYSYPNKKIIFFINKITVNCISSFIVNKTNIFIEILLKNEIKFEKKLKNSSKIERKIH